MRSVGALVFEGVEKADDVFPAGMLRLRGDNLLEELDLVDGGLCVVCGGAHDFEGDVLAGGVVAR